MGKGGGVLIGGGFDEGFNALDGEVEGVLGHVGEADSEPTGFDAVAGGAGRDVQPHLVHNLLPQLHLRFEGVGRQQMPHVHPAE